MVIPTVKLNNGQMMQAFGLGTYASKGGEGKKAVKDAIDLGYRHFDTAYFYGNEAEVGEGIREKIAEGVIKREDVFVVTKLWCHFHDPEVVEHACKLSNKNLGLDYIDMYLMHWPFGYKYEGDTVTEPKDANGKMKLSDVDYIDTWRAMEKLVALGLTKGIGVSNFNVKQLKRLLPATQIKPAHNQVEFHPGNYPKELIEYCKSQNIVVTGYSPLKHPHASSDTLDYLHDPKIVAIGKKYNKSAAQVILRFLVECGVVPIPKSATKSRIAENSQVFDFKLDNSDLKTMESFNIRKRVVTIDAEASKYYPFKEDGI